MKKAKQLILILLVIIFSSLVTFKVKASEELEKPTNIEQMTVNEVNKLFYDLTDGIINHNSTKLPSGLIEQSAKTDLDILLVNNTIGGKLENVVVDFTYPENSSTGDTVVMVNAKVNYDNYYTKLYLFEYHVNASGKIYGYNVWVY